RLAALLRRRRHQRLPQVRWANVRRTERAADLLQKGSEAIVGDELFGAEQLHRRLAAEWLRRGPAARATAQEIRLSADHPGDGGACCSLLALSRTQGRG